MLAALATSYVTWPLAIGYVISTGISNGLSLFSERGIFGDLHGMDSGPKKCGLRKGWDSDRKFESRWAHYNAGTGEPSSGEWQKDFQVWQVFTSFHSWRVFTSFAASASRGALSELMFAAADRQSLRFQRSEIFLSKNFAANFGITFCHSALHHWWRLADLSRSWTARRRTVSCCRFGHEIVNIGGSI